MTAGPSLRRFDLVTPLVGLVVLVIHLHRALRVPVLHYGDSSNVYLPFARTLWESGPRDAYPILTSLNRVPIYPHVTAFGWALDPASGRPIVLLNVVFLLVTFVLTHRALARVGLGPYAGIVFVFYGLEFHVLRFSVRVGPDSLVLLFGVLFVAASIEHLRPGSDPLRLSRRLGLIAAFSALTRIFPLGYMVAFHVLEWRWRPKGASPVKAARAFYGRLIVGFGLGSLPFTLYLLTLGFPYPLAGPPGHGPGLLAKGTVFELVGRVLRRVLWDRPLLLTDLVLHPVILLFLALSILAVLRTEPRRLWPAGLAGLIFLPLSFVHFEARYYALVPWAAGAVIAAGAHCADRWLGSGRGAKGAGPIPWAPRLKVFRFVALVGLLPFAGSDVVQAERGLEQLIRFRAQHDAECKEIASEVPPGALIFIRREGFGHLYDCLFDIEPIYGFVDRAMFVPTTEFMIGDPRADWVPEALRDAIAFHAEGNVHPIELEPRVKAEVIPPWTPLEGPKRPWKVSSPSWKRFRRTFCAPMKTGRYALQLEVSEAGIPLWVRLRFHPKAGSIRSLSPWYIPAQDGLHRLTFSAQEPGRLCLEIGPHRRKWPAGQTTVLSLTSAREEQDPKPETSP